MALNCIERRLVDQWRNVNCNNFGRRLQLLGLSAFVELMPTDIRRPGQDAVKLPDTPAPAITSENAPLVEVGDDRFHAHGA
ncbi:MAG TPA: hypothetical protein VGF56_01350 [Rhizomicrobium sp.]|jgi:hypothetical protein